MIKIQNILNFFKYKKRNERISFWVYLTYVILFLMTKIAIIISVIIVIFSLVFATVNTFILPFLILIGLNVEEDSFLSSYKTCFGYGTLFSLLFLYVGGIVYKSYLVWYQDLEKETVEKNDFIPFRRITEYFAVLKDYYSDTFLSRILLTIGTWTLIFVPFGLIFFLTFKAVNSPELGILSTFNSILSFIGLRGFVGSNNKFILGAILFIIIVLVIVVSGFFIYGKVIEAQDTKNKARNK